MGSVATSPLMEKLNLRKAGILNLKKTIGLDGQKASVVFVLDKSGSMSGLYNNGFVQRLTERILPLGLAFDDNGEVDFYIFHDKAFKHPKNITLSTVTQVIPEVISKYGYEGTNYAPPIKMILDDFIGKKSSGIFGMGKSDRPSKKLEHPIYVIYITDGQNSDKSDTDSIIREASGHPIYFQFVGIGNASFSYLEKLDDLSGRVVDNAGFFQANDLERLSDDELYSKMLKEFPSFVKEVRSKNWII